MIISFCFFYYLLYNNVLQRYEKQLIKALRSLKQNIPNEYRKWYQMLPMNDIPFSLVENVLHFMCFEKYYLKINEKMYTLVLEFLIYFYNTLKY